MTISLPLNTMSTGTLTPTTSARLTSLEADIEKLRRLDGAGAKAYLDGISIAMNCGPYTGVEDIALSEIQNMLEELDIEKAALKLGLFVSELLL